jgi:hypothetical protein
VVGRMSNCHVSYWKMCAMHSTLSIATILLRGPCLVSLGGTLLEAVTSAQNTKYLIKRTEPLDKRDERRGRRFKWF